MTHWSSQSLGWHVGLHASTVGRLWQQWGLKPWLLRTSKRSMDPAFEAKLRDVVGLYLHPPERAVVLCVDRPSARVRLSEPIKEAIRTLQRHASVWTPAIRQDGTVRDGAHVAEAIGLVDLSATPDGTRLLVRREPLHPGAQPTFDDEDGYRFTAFVTDQDDGDLAVLDARHRAQARVEQRIRDAKDSGLANLPSADFQVNTIWLQLVLAAQDLLAFFAVLTLDGDLAAAEPKTLRYRLLQVAGRITTSARRPTLHLDRDWPWLDDLLTAFTRIRALP